MSVLVITLGIGVVLLVIAWLVLFWAGSRVDAAQQQKINAQWSMLDEIITAWVDINTDDCIQSDVEFRNLARRMDYLTTYVMAERDERRARGES